MNDTFHPCNTLNILGFLFNYVEDVQPSLSCSDSLLLLCSTVVDVGKYLRSYCFLFNYRPHTNYGGGYVFRVSVQPSTPVTPLTPLSPILPPPPYPLPHVKVSSGD